MLERFQFEICLFIMVCVALMSACSLLSGTEIQQSPIEACGLGNFTQSESEHIIEEYERPIVVRLARGTVQPDEGTWPEGHKVIMEIRRLDASAEAVRSFEIEDSDGRFHFSNVPAGRYCFKATAMGWTSVVGFIDISQAAPVGSEIHVTMKLGQ